LPLLHPFSILYGLLRDINKAADMILNNAKSFGNDEAIGLECV
jgi:hypothetical protein